MVPSLEIDGSTQHETTEYSAPLATVGTGFGSHQWRGTRTPYIAFEIGDDMNEKGRFMREKLEEGENHVLGPPRLSHTYRLSSARARRYAASALLPQKPIAERVRESGTLAPT
jgi:hypothetical protein